MVKRSVLFITPIDCPEDRVRRIEGFLRGLANEGTQVDVMSLPGGPTDLEYHVDDHRAMTMMLDWAVHYEGRHDGVVVGCFYDPAVRELREILDVPVLGLAEASMLVASSLGHSMSVLVTTRKCVPKMADNALVCGFDRRIVSWRSIGVSVHTLQKDPKAVYGAMLKAGQAAVRDDGAEVIVLGCGSMEDAASRLQEDLSCPVVDPTAAGFKMVETLADLRVRLGLSTSKVCDYRPKAAITETE